jgi:hypothetical protein
MEALATGLLEAGEVVQLKIDRQSGAVTAVVSDAPTRGMEDDAVQDASPGTASRKRLRETQSLFTVEGISLL